MNEFLNLQGYGPMLAQGAWMTVKLAFLALALSLGLGLIAAGAKLSSVKLLRVPATLYTTLIRSVPDLVLILLIFYSLQLWLNDLTEAFGWNYFEIDPFTAGVVTLGFIYGAYFTENFRGAILSVPAGQLEAATAYGLSRWQTVLQRLPVGHQRPLGVLARVGVEVIERAFDQFEAFQVGGNGKVVGLFAITGPVSCQALVQRTGGITQQL